MSAGLISRLVQACSGQAMVLTRRTAACLVVASFLLAAGLGMLNPTLADDADGIFDPDAVIAAHGFAPHQVGYLAVDLRDGAILEQRNADASFIPASVTKIPATVAALASLGWGHRFETALYRTGPVVEGVLRGDLYLVGGGDPLLTADDLAELVVQAQQGGIRDLAGTFHYDAGFLTQLAAIDPDQPETATYNPGISALSVNFNVIQVSWETDPAEGTLSITATSNTDTQRVPADSAVFAVAQDASGQRSTFRLGDSQDSDVWVIARHVSPEGQDWLPVRATALNTAMVFRRMAQERGLGLPTPTEADLPDGAVQVASHQSPPLARIVRGVLRYSNNLSAELVGLVATRTLSGQALPLADSARFLDHWLQGRIGEGDWDSYRGRNHSGLAADARTTPRQMVDILRYADSLDSGDDSFVGLLPLVATIEPGRPNSRQDRVIEVRAKSGTLYYGSGLAGYLLMDGQPKIAFAVFVSDLEARRRLDSADDPAARNRPPGAQHWLARARTVQRALLDHWAETRAAAIGR